MRFGQAPVLSFVQGLAGAYGVMVDVAVYSPTGIRIPLTTMHIFS
ncbi:hypothetical protein SAMN07250955_11094 [Arboricoccus pini]|uniref:Uncharacterized protein n=1 Tax=Arboricoccus pini TaxID=1963835 RepID=A0A212RLN0_9PROT|nr:hypothetical protein SAMN07250955_11094 [Arboricoccus pini]